MVGVCEDDPAMRSVLLRAIKMAGHDVSLARSGLEAVRDFPGAGLHVAILDIGLPDADGRDVCLALRAAGLRCPVLFLTARDGVHDKVSGFQSGGDDYLTKPFELPELLARVEALTRRAPIEPRPSAGLRLDPAQHIASHGDVSTQLTPTEFRLLATLVGLPGQVVRRRRLVAAGWPDGAIVHENTLDSYIRRLRNKLQHFDGLESSIDTVRGVGYSWR